LRNHALGMGAKIFARRCVMYARRAIWICRTGRSRLTSTVAFGPTLLLMLNLTAGNYLVLMVGVAGFEPTTPCPPVVPKAPKRFRSFPINPYKSKVLSRRLPSAPE
jgi:hypothetical protein